jgi:hypothetical protein
MKEQIECIKRLDVYEVERFHRRFWSLCRPAMERLDENPCAEIIWPRANVCARAIPNAIHPLDRIDGYDHAEKLDSYYSMVSPSGLIFWDYHVPHIGSYLGPYNRDMRCWVEDKMIATIWCAVSPDLDLAIVMYRDLEASIVMGRNKPIAALDRVFGGKEALRQVFIDHVETGGFAGSVRFSGWAYEHIFPKCGWEVPKSR